MARTAVNQETLALTISLPQTKTQPPDTRARSRVLAVLIASMLTVCAAVAPSYGPFAKPGAKSVRSVRADRVSAQVPFSAPIAAPAIRQTRALIRASDNSWITACVDGKAVFSKLFTNGSRYDLPFTSRAVVRAGNAGPVDIFLNGKPIGPVGHAGEVSVVELTPSASRIITRGAPADCTQ